MTLKDAIEICKKVDPKNLGEKISFELFVKFNRKNEFHEEIN